MSLVPRKLPPLWSPEISDPYGNYFSEPRIVWNYDSWSQFLGEEPWNRNALYGHHPIFWHWWTDENEDESEPLSDQLWIVYPAFQDRVITCLFDVRRDEEPEIRAWLRGEFAHSSYLWGLGLVDQTDAMNAAVTEYLEAVHTVLLQVFSDRQICERILALVEIYLEKRKL